MPYVSHVLRGQFYESEHPRQRESGLLGLEAFVDDEVGLSGIQVSNVMYVRPRHDEVDQRRSNCMYKEMF